ncbi:HPP family protein [Pelomonas sp. CA6]|uniref:CBS domain-containing protein n=1 Tax=Pelomonas sp. CA6 TaxID=2907999 RepID=UPI0024077ADF|nr:CBS domain-containing protein [Pelomonas sp. CA6]
MFAVYGMQGRVYSGAMEQVRDLGAVQAVARTRAVAPVAGQDTPNPASVVIALAEREAGGGAGARQGPPMAGPGAALAAYAQAPDRHPLREVQQLMNPRVVSVAQTATLRQAWGRLAEAGVGQAPVLSPQRRLVGLVLRADLLRDLPQDPALMADWLARLDQPVSRFMWTPVPVAHPETPLREAAQLMLDLGLPGLPVADADGAVQGFLSRSDLLRALTREPPLDLWS